ncbi:MAG: hypothetical protein ACPL25_05110 [Ignavibacteria bacterium]
MENPVVLYSKSISLQDFYNAILQVASDGPRFFIIWTDVEKESGLHTINYDA